VVLSQTPRHHTGASLLVHPVIAESYARALGDAVSGDSLDPDLLSAALDSVDLLARFAVLSEGRLDQG
jgi:hypothetical protein